jgi:quercetin dioxygenase-like cupin family protein
VAAGPVAERGAVTVRRADDVRRDPVGAGKGTVRQVLIGPDEGPNFALRRFIMEPGGGMPPHTNTVEHEQYVLRGRARIGIGEEVHDVAAGAVVFIPAGTPHWYEAAGDEPFEFLCVVPNGPDTIELVGEKRGKRA